MPPAQYQSLQTSTAGELTGVGLQITRDKDSDLLEVISPIEGSPAAAADLRPADQILQIDQTQTKDLTLDSGGGADAGSGGQRCDVDGAPTR